MKRSWAKIIAEKIGIDTHAFLFRFLKRNAGSVLEAKLSLCDTGTRDLLSGEDERYHYGDTEIREKAMEFVLTSFTIDRIEFVREFGRFEDSDTIADLGDSNGIFLRACGQDGISENISDPAVKSLHGRGMDTVMAHIEYLPFKRDSVHTIFLFETLEHVPNPISLLNEIGRVCSDSVIISIPYVKMTKIHSFNYDPTRPLYQHHIFEFNRKDFQTIITHTPFVLEAERVAVVLDEKQSIKDRILFSLWERFVEKDTFCECFKKFYICKLRKKTIPGTGT